MNANDGRALLPPGRRRVSIVSSALFDGKVKCLKSCSRRDIASALQSNHTSRQNRTNTRTCASTPHIRPMLAAFSSNSAQVSPIIRLSLSLENRYQTPPLCVTICSKLHRSHSIAFRSCVVIVSIAALEYCFISNFHNARSR